KPHNLADQMENLDGLNLDPEGAWYAVRWDGFHFVHPKMDLKGDSLTQFFTKYPSLKWNKNFHINYEKLLELVQTPNMVYQDAETAFHRYVGCSEKIAAPYQSYVTLTKTLEQLPVIENI